MKNLLAALLAAIISASTSSFAEEYCSPQCVKYASDNSEIQIGGHAYTWIGSAPGLGYTTGSTPRAGSVMSFPQQGDPDTNLRAYGHVAVVTSIIDDDEIMISHSNWDGPCVESTVRVRDVSSSGDWSRVNVWFSPITNYGGTEYVLNGFIYPKEIPDEVKIPVDLSCVGNICWEPATENNPNGCWDADHVYLAEHFDERDMEVALNFCQGVLNQQQQLATAVASTDSSESVPHDTLEEIADEGSGWYGFWRAVYDYIKSIAAPDARADFVRVFTVERTLWKNLSTNELEIIGSSDSPLGIGVRRSNEESAVPELFPDFIVPRVILEKGGIEKYKYLPNTSVDAVAWVKNVGDVDWAPDDSGKIHDDIEVRYYLSGGFSEDAHSEWDRTGSEIIQSSNLRLVDDAKKETDGFTTPSSAGIYNIVVCADRTEDSGNEDGDVLEKHKSNNCSSEAVFEVVEHDLTVFDFWRAHEPIYATGGTGGLNFEARFKVTNNAGQTQVIDDMRIDAYREGSFAFTCWEKDSSTNIGPAQTYEMEKEFCEIQEEGNYHLEAKMKINGRWRPMLTHPSFFVEPPLDLTFIDFYQKPEPIYATNGDGSMNFYTGFRLRNNGTRPVLFKWINIGLVRDNAVIFNCLEKTTPTTIQPGAIYDTGSVSCDIWHPGEYNLEVDIHLDSAVGWVKFTELPPFHVTTAGLPSPDLQVSELTISENELFAGESMSISSQVKNVGDALSTPSTVRFKISLDSIIDVYDQDISSRIVGGLAMNEETNSLQHIFNAPVIADSYWLGACIDTIDNESAIQTNCSASQQLIVKPGPMHPADPATDIDWFFSEEDSVADIENRFNTARANENNQLGLSLPMMDLPDQAEWDRLSEGEKALWLVNRERIDRGVLPLEGIDYRVTSVSQNYANYLLANNTFGSMEDGSTPWGRLNSVPAIAECHDDLGVAENLAVFWRGWSLTTERAVFNWMYDDRDYGWEHRHTILWTPYNNNSGSIESEGLLGIGIARGTHQGQENSTLIVMNVFDPCASWVSAQVLAGDVKPDGTVNLTDAVIALRTVVGLNVVVEKEADINNDGRIGLPEALYVMKKMAEL